MKYIRNNELTLANTVPQLVAGRTGDLQLAYKWTHCVHAVLAGPTTVAAGCALVHICRRRTRVTVCEMTGRGGDYEVEVKQTHRDHWWTRLVCNSLPPTATMMGLNESAADGRQQKNTEETNKGSHCYIQEFEAYQEITCFAFACMKITSWETARRDCTLPFKFNCKRHERLIHLSKACESGFQIHCEYFFYYWKEEKKALWR